MDTLQSPQIMSTTKNPMRKKALMMVTIFVVLSGFIVMLYEWQIFDRYESTDNAYVQGNIVQITPQISGTVTAILADDTDFVRSGQPLIKLDPADAHIALNQAEAALAQTVRQVRTLYANNESLASQIAVHEADLARAKIEVDRARIEVARATDDVNRRQVLITTGAVSKEELSHLQTQLENTHDTLASAEAGVTAAEAAVVTARKQLASNQTMTEDTGIETHPGVRIASEKLREAWLTTQRTTLPAPLEGYVAKRTVQLGQRVAAGASMMSIIPLSQVWVDANFKEAQLQKIRIGQSVSLTADVYGKKITYKGTVAGLSAGTGAAFSLLPAQNATGNWIKVVQRVPVRVVLDPAQIASHPLRVGLSMDVTVNVSNQSGKNLADASSLPSVTQTQVYRISDTGADEAVRRIIAANRGQSIGKTHTITKT